MRAFPLPRRGVCLRCQLQPVWRSPTRLISSSTDQSLRVAANTHHGQRTEEILSDRDIEVRPGESVHSSDLAFERPTDARGRSGTWRPHDAADAGYRFKRLPLNLNKIALEVQTLGEPASILRLDVNRPKRGGSAIRHSQVVRSNEPESVPPTTESTSEDILKSMEDDEAQVSLDEIVKSIENIRAEWETTLDLSYMPAQAQCVELAEQLARAFTAKQLEAYLRAAKNDATSDYDDFEGIFTADCCERSRWYSGTSTLSETLGMRFRKTPGEINMSTWPLAIDLLQWKRQKEKGKKVKMPPRMQTCEEILRRCFKLRAQEEVETVGEVDVRIEHLHWRLLNERFDLLRKLERLYQIEFEYSNGLSCFRIRGAYQSCKAAFTSVFACLNHLRTERLHLNRAGQENLAPIAGLSAFLAGIETHTQSIITPFFTGVGIRKLAGFDVLFSAAQRLDIAEPDITSFMTVSRIMNSTVSDRSQQPVSLCLPQLSPALGLDFPLAIQENLPLQDRGFSWSRYSVSAYAGQQRDSRDLLDICRAAMLFAKLMSVTRWNYSEHDGVSPVEGWSPQNIYKISLRIGSIIRALQTPVSRPRRVRSQEALRERLDREANSSEAKVSATGGYKLNTLAPGSPGGFRDFDRLADIKPSSEQYIVLRFKPQKAFHGTSFPFSPGFDQLDLPDLLVKLQPLDFTEEGVRVLDIQLERSDVMNIHLPLEHTDLQLLSQKCVDATVPMYSDFDTFVSGIRAYDGNIDERSVPPTLDLSIPLRACQSTHARSRIPDSQRVSTKSHSQRPLETSLPLPSSDDLSDSWSEFYARQQPQNNIDGENDEQLEEAVREKGEFRSSFRTHPQPKAQAGKSGHKEDTPVEPSVEVRYQFINTEYHSRLRSTFRGYPLTYAIVDGGVLGGRQEELILGAPAEEIPDDFSSDRSVSSTSFAAKHPADGYQKGVAEEALSLSRLINETFSIEALHSRREAASPFSDDWRTTTNTQAGEEDLIALQKFKNELGWKHDEVPLGDTWLVPWIGAAIDLVKTL